jgi:hypothetical protein
MPAKGNTLEELSERSVGHDIASSKRASPRADMTGSSIRIDVRRALDTAGHTTDLTDSDDRFEYRHVILPKQMLKLIPKSCVLQMVTLAATDGMPSSTTILHPISCRLAPSPIVMFQTTGISRRRIRDYYGS